MWKNMWMYEKQQKHPRSRHAVAVTAAVVSLLGPTGCGRDAATGTGEPAATAGAASADTTPSAPSTPGTGADAGGSRHDVLGEPRAASGLDAQGDRRTEIAACIDRVAPELDRLVNQMVDDFRRDTEGLSAFDPEFADKLAAAEQRWRDPAFVAVVDQMEAAIRAECF
jgi:hypothetical protein